MTTQIHLDDPPEHLTEAVAKDLEQFHPEGSPYRGLPLHQQRMLAVLRRGGRKPPRAFMRSLHVATEEDYGKILAHCVQAMIQQSEAHVDMRMDRLRVRLKLVFTYRKHFGKQWPRGVPLAYYDWAVLIEYKVDAIIDYLHKIGQSTFNAKQLRKELWAIKAEQDRHDFLLDYCADVSIAEFYNYIIPEAPKRPDKALKGRRHYRKSGVHGKGKETLDTPPIV